MSNRLPPLVKRQVSRQLLVENKLTYAGSDSELSIYDTYRQASHVGLDAPSLMYCGMVQGKKIMHAPDAALPEQQGTLFLPHESFVIPPGGHVDIDFPDAEESNPTTCLTIEISKEKVLAMSEKMRDVVTSDNPHHDWEYQPHIIHAEHTADTQKLLERMVELYTSNHPDKALFMELSLSELIIRLLRQQGRDFLLAYCHQSPDATGITAAIYFIEKNLTLPLDLDKLCKIACMSRSKLYIAFKKQVGCTPGEFQQQLRLKQAATKIKQGIAISNACYSVGFSDLSHFSRRFSQCYGISPTAYKEKYLP